MYTTSKIFTAIAMLLCISSSAQVGIFDKSSDVGAVLHNGSASFDKVAETYTVAGSGINIWGAHDEFQFVWKKMKGDFIVQCKGSLIGKGVELHRKFGWMVRNNLDSGSVMASVHVHGDGLTSLQYRKFADSNVAETQSAIKMPDMIQLERRGSKFIMSAAHFGEPFVVTEASDIVLNDEVYVGLFVCSHNKDVTEKAVFSNVRIILPAKEAFVPYRDYIGSQIEILNVSDGSRQIVYSSPASLQAPNWTKDGKALIYNSNGAMYRFDMEKRTPSLINTDVVKSNNNDHVLSFDGKMLGLSSASGDAKFGSMVYVVPVGGGKPKQITPTGPSYLHGWSPDGKTLTFTGQRDGELDIYKVPVNGGPEVRLTTAKGLDDGSEYSPDGKYIYFNSTRSGLMQLWRMEPDGSDQEQLTTDEYNNWFPHISPDGKMILFLSFSKDINPEDHPFYKHVYLRTMPVSGGKPKVVAYFYGGQGSINTPSWSPDSKRVAFVSNTDVK